MPAPVRNTICLVVDALHAGYLGAYGNTWLATPHFDRLASESFLFDSAFLDTPDLEQLYRSYWQGIHAAVPEHFAAEPRSLPALLAARGVETILLADDPRIAGHPAAVDFDDVVPLDLPASTSARELAETEEATELARFFAQLIGRLEGQREPFFLWGHCGTLGRVWDAPLSLRRALLAEEADDDSGPAHFEAVPFESLEAVEPPAQLLSLDHDPDERLGWRRAYAAQIVVLDRCLGALREALVESAWGGNTLLVILGARGFPLGEHRQLGWPRWHLHDELIHFPWSCRFPDHTAAALRTPALVQPADLPATLAEWHGLPPAGEGSFAPPGWGRSLWPLVQGEVEQVRDRVLTTTGAGEFVLRTPAWMLRKLPVGAAPRDTELFVKPDDRWEVNEIGDRCPEVLAEMDARLDELRAPGRMLDPNPLEPLSDSLLRGPN
ncbi:MAG: sulfatase-like hydrolase/transferase [Planctomycetaceae bacterium]|nr:sulfatase-like hydrolase/transferase [Planctomycetaceae bacterium]